MPSPEPITIAVVNSSGRQAASFIRVASAVGYHVRAQLRNLDGIVAQEISSLPNVTCLIGDLYLSPTTPTKSTQKNHVNHANEVNTKLINQLFSGADLAFINTTFYGNEVAIGMALADAAKATDIKHYIYSSMPDYSAINDQWPSLPLWSPKHKVEEYIRSIGLPATFVYTGIYNNNFTSLPYPLFQMEGPLEDGSFEWQAPFHPDAKLPWLDAEHDVGPAVLQLVKDGVRKWGGHRIALAFEMLTPVEACEAFSRGINRPVRYVHGPIEIKVKIPEGYQDQLDAISKLYPLDLDDPAKQPPYFGDWRLEESCPEEAWRLWEGPRSLEEYAREVFPLEEEANGLVWMHSDGAALGDGGESVVSEEFLEVGGKLEGLELKTPATPARNQEDWLA